MADAGKIVITPKGAYSSTATYEWLDEVTYDGKAYIALKTVTGVTPSDDGVNWRLFLEPNDIVAGNLVPTFTEASTRSNIVSGENLSTMFGKIKKWFTDLKSHAFKDLVNNLTTETTGSALDASQGKILKDEVDVVNSNLDEQGYGENSGGDNVWNEKYVIGGINSSGEIAVYTTAIRSDYFSIKPSTKYTIIKNTPNFFYAFYDENKTVIGVRLQLSEGNGQVTTPTNAKYMIIMINGTTNYDNDISVIEGDATEYKPYIMSNKQLTDKVNQQNESLDDYGLNKANSIFENGTMLSGSGEKLNANNRIRNVDFLKATNTARIIIKNAKSDYQWTYVYFFNNGTYVTDINLGKITDKTVTIPSNANQVKFVVSCSDNFTPNDFDIDIYCDNAIDELKNDLDKLNSLPKGSIIQIEADKDDTKTTTQKYGWQYLGTSNIQYENGSANLLVTNVYRKNN